MRYPNKRNFKTTESYISSVKINSFYLFATLNSLSFALAKAAVKGVPKIGKDGS